MNQAGKIENRAEKGVKIRAPKRSTGEAFGRQHWPMKHNIHYQTGIAVRPDTISGAFDGPHRSLFGCDFDSNSSILNVALINHSAR